MTGKMYKSNFLKMTLVKFIHSYGVLLSLALLVNSLFGCTVTKQADIPGPVTDSIPALMTLPVKARFFTTDKLLQVYVVTTGNEVVKFNSSGEQVFLFNNNLLGDLSHIDATNPFKLLLYYSEYLTIVTLDRTLNPTGEIRLNELNLLEVQAVGLSNDNQVWLYDEQGRKLRKLDQSGRILFETADLNQLLGKTIHPTQLLERDNRVFLNDPEYGIFLFDNFGQYLNTLDIKGAKNLHFRNGLLFFEKEEQAMVYELRTLEFSRLPLPTRADQWRIEGDRVFILQGDQIRIFARKGMSKR